MAQYYFAASFLPFLSYDTEKTITIDDFIELCRDQCTEKDWLVIKRTNINELEYGVPSCSTLEKWITWEINLRNELVRHRAANKKSDPALYLREAAETIDLSVIAQNAFGQESPLAAEEILNRARWSYLDELEFGHYFDIDRLVVYSLKLQILERKNSFDFEKGREICRRFF